VFQWKQKYIKVLILKNFKMPLKITKGGLILRKQEMTQLWVNDEFVPVTILKVVPQEVIRHKLEDKDGYNALVV
jgi:hypothetical protein